MADRSGAAGRRTHHARTRMSRKRSRRLWCAGTTAVHVGGARLIDNVEIAETDRLVEPNGGVRRPPSRGRCSGTLGSPTATVTADRRVIAAFEDGGEAVGDVLIGADAGSGSSSRRPGPRTCATRLRSGRTPPPRVLTSKPEDELMGISASIEGRPGRPVLPYVHFRFTSWRCHRRRVAGVTRKATQPSRRIARLAAARRTRSMIRSLGGPVFHCSTRNWWRRTRDTRVGTIGAVKHRSR